MMTDVYFIADFKAMKLALSFKVELWYCTLLLKSMSSQEYMCLNWDDLYIPDFLDKFAFFLFIFFSFTFKYGLNGFMIRFE